MREKQSAAAPGGGRASRLNMALPSPQRIWQQARSSRAGERGGDRLPAPFVVGVNRFRTTEPSPLTADLETAIQGVDAGVEAAAVSAVRRWREERDADPERRERAASALARLVADARTDADKRFYERLCNSLDAQIDDAVYNLYDITPAERKIIES